ncbi:hypothetical protein [Modicisalibacter luteus]|uniref:Uncharacterized protein n=1 Tax=Modicisalibacter luteus TaxID=453962 RepID=A0ABV7LZP2_9GAMM|nr:hypothetical protein [Halomonas lutea]
MNRTIKEATIRAFHYTSLGLIQSHLTDYFGPITLPSHSGCAWAKYRFDIFSSNGEKSPRGL